MIYKNLQKIKFLHVVIIIAVMFAAMFAYNKQPYTEGIFWQVSKNGEVLGHIYGAINMKDEKDN